MPVSTRPRVRGEMETKKSVLSYKNVIYFSLLMSSLLLVALTVFISGGAAVSWRTLLAPLTTINLFHIKDVQARQDPNIHDLVERLRAEKARHDPSQAKLIFGYSACLDVAVNARDFIPLVLERFGITDAQPKFHSKIETAKDFVESFLLFFSQGANAEQRVRNPEIFKILAELARSIDGHKK